MCYIIIIIITLFVFVAIQQYTCTVYNCVECVRDYIYNVVIFVNCYYLLDKSKMFSDALPRELEPKKSFRYCHAHLPHPHKHVFHSSERFKLNIRAKNKKSDLDVKQTSPLSKAAMPITASLGGNSKLKARDDNALVTSVPTHEKQRLKGRTKSHGQQYGMYICTSCVAAC